MIPVLAWRNIWRNKLRSLVVIVSVMLGIFSGIFLIALTNGMVKDRVDTIIGLEVSHIQIHRPGFQQNTETKLYMPDASRMVSDIKRLPRVKASSKRWVLNAMISSAETGTGVKLVGIDPSDEKQVTILHHKVVSGEYFPEQSRNALLIGERLAKKLKVNLKNKCIITLQDADNNITAGAFRVVGIFRTENYMYDESVVFVRTRDVSRLINLPETAAHEVAVLLDNDEFTPQLKQTLSKQYSQLEVQEWHQLSPEAGYLVSIMSQYMIIIMVVILLALCFGIINTMLMVVLERVHELGMLMAIGMNRRRVFGMIMLETIFLSLTGGVLGMGVGYLVIHHYYLYGLDLYFWKEAYESIGYSSVIHPFIAAKDLLQTTSMIIVTGILSALYPAYKALKINPADAIRS
ncbi:MAG: FtsX-like permease family protein [Bacteroidota bacterium]|nr:FtsX-like permease family protein [Bacteroidota bacterium]